MTGADIIGALLLADVDVLALVPAERIKAAALPDNVPLPALLVRMTSGVERQTLKRGAAVINIDRVSVAVRAESYRDQREAIRLVKACCAAKTGAVGELSSLSVLTAGTGPDLRGPGDSYEQTQDFKVTYVA